MKYMVMVYGKNILLNDHVKRRLSSKIKSTKTFGCVASRLIIADSPEEACKLAIEAALNELFESKDMSIINDESNPPTFAIEEFRELSEDEEIRVPRSGFTFFPE